MAKILLVEDDKSLREIYGVRLMAEGYEIVSAGDGEEALAMAIKERPALIVSDVMMPKISGFDMLDILRSTTETKDVKVIMMTALSSDDQRARGEKLGADRYLVKSQVGIEDVVRTVHDVLGDGVPGAAPAPTNFSPAAPTTTPPAPVPAPVVPDTAPVTPAEPVAPPAPPVAPTPMPVSEPIVSAPASVAVAPTPEPAAPPVINLPPAPVPVPDPAPMPAPVAEPAMPAPTPVAPMPPAAPEPFKLPEPTAPFSSPRPASLGDRVINPINPIDMSAPTDIAAQMNQELNATSQPPTPPAPPQPPIPPAPTV
jgi:CheY-like chemotaxis protein